MIEIPHYHFERVSSTNDVAKELLETVDCLFVTAEYQYEGRGRKGRAWEGESHKNIYLTYGVNELKIDSIKNKVIYQIIGCLAVEEALTEYIESERVRIKYPNDVYIADEMGIFRKIAGVLSEHSYSGNKCEESILGIGINVNQTDFDNVLVQKATSMKLLGYKCDTEKLVSQIKTSLLRLLESDETQTFEKWKSKVNLIGKNVTIVDTGMEYIIDSISPDGSLRASNQNGSININNGDSIIYEF